MKKLTICCLVLACVLALPVLSGADVEQGVLAYQQGNFEAAYKAFVPEAEAGDPAAQYGLGVLYYRGKGVERDYVQSWKWFKLAADQGHEQAKVQLPAVEAKLLPEELERAKDEAAAFAASAPEPVAEPAVEPVTEPLVEPVPSIVEPLVEPVTEPVAETPEIDTNAIHPNAPEEAEPTLPDFPPLANAPEAETPETSVAEVTEPVTEPAAQPPALPLPGLNKPVAPAVEPAVEPVPEPVPEPVSEAMPEAMPEAMSEADGALGTVEEAEYLFYYPKGFESVDSADAQHAYGRGQAELSVAVNEVGGAEGPMEPKLCQQISGLMMADLMQRADSSGGMGGDFLGGGGPKPEVRAVAPPKLEDVGPGVQRCSFAFAHNIGGDWQVVEQANYYKLKVPKLYCVTMRYLRDTADGDAMRPAYEAFEVK